MTVVRQHHLCSRVRLLYETRGRSLPLDSLCDVAEDCFFLSYMGLKLQRQLGVRILALMVSAVLEALCCVPVLLSLARL